MQFMWAFQQFSRLSHRMKPVQSKTVTRKSHGIAISVPPQGRPSSTKLCITYIIIIAICHIYPLFILSNLEVYKGNTPAPEPEATDEELFNEEVVRDTK